MGSVQQGSKVSRFLHPYDLFCKIIHRIKSRNDRQILFLSASLFVFPHAANSKAPIITVAVKDIFHLYAPFNEQIGILRFINVN